MPTFEEYINGLEGQTDLDPLKIARDLHSLHSEEVGIRNAKIDELTSTIAERDSALLDFENDLKAQKSKNFDLVMQIPSSSVQPVNSGDDPDEAQTTIDDLFVK